MTPVYVEGGRICHGTMASASLKYVQVHGMVQLAITCFVQKYFWLFRTNIYTMSLSRISISAISRRN